MEDYEILERLGGGSFADVYKAKEKSTNTLVAIKVLKKKYSKFEDCLDLRECKSLQKLNHIPNEKGIENIIKLKQIIFIKESGTLNLIFEYMEKDLFELMKKKKKLNENEIREISYQTLLGLSLMHKYGFFHRDLKPENLLVSNNKKIKIADFGLAREIRSVPPYTEYVSTRYYRAPECILKSNNYNSPIDIWALGCIIAEMYLHPIPIFFGNNEKEVLFKINSILGFPYNWNEGIQLGKKLNIKFLNCKSIQLKNVIVNASNDAIDLIQLMLQWDPNKRPTANNLLNHPFFQGCCFNNNSKLYDISNFCIKEKNRKINLAESKISKGSLNDEINISRILNDTEGFDKLINKLKKEKREEDKRFEIEKNDFNFGVVSTSTNLIVETNGNSVNLDNNKGDENNNFNNEFNLNNNNKEYDLNNNNKEFNLDNDNNKFNLDNNNNQYNLDNNNIQFNLDNNNQFNLDNNKEYDLDKNNKFNLDNNDNYKIDNNNEFNIDNKNNFNLDNNKKYDLDTKDNLNKFNIENNDKFNIDNKDNLNKYNIENNDKFNIDNEDLKNFEIENNTKNIKDYIPNCFKKRSDFDYSPSKFYRNNIRNLYNKDNNSPIYANNNSSSGENSTNINSNSNANSPNKYNNNNGRELDFDTNIRLKNINNNIQRRSARKFIEETENKLGKPNNKFQFNEKLNFQNPIMIKNDFGLRRNNTNNEYKNNSFNRQLNNNNIDIAFKRREIDNNNINNNINNNLGSNGILFGMESRRIHNNNSNLKNWKV